MRSFSPWTVSTIAPWKSAPTALPAMRANSRRQSENLFGEVVPRCRQAAADVPVMFYATSDGAISEDRARTTGWQAAVISPLRRHSSSCRDWPSHNRRFDVRANTDNAPIRPGNPLQARRQRSTSTHRCRRDGHSGKDDVTSRKTIVRSSEIGSIQL